jgi:hypothetical protein
VSTLHDFVRMEAEGLGVGATLSAVLCPACGGGERKSRKFSITRNPDGLLYHCFRASCGASGFIPTAGILLQGGPMPTDTDTRAKRRVYTGELHPLEPADKEYFMARFGIECDALPAGLLNVNERGEYVTEIRDSLGRGRGYVVRRGGWSGEPAAPRQRKTDGPKSLVFMNDPRTPAQAWMLPAGYWGKRILLVEDCMSAIVATFYGWKACALLGTHLNAERVREIALELPTEVVIALDRDATNAAFGMARKWGLAFPKVRVMPLLKDIKDTSSDELNRLLA